MLILFLVGIFMFVLGYQQQKLRQIPKERIVYRYIPRTFDEEQQNPVKVSHIFSKMFQESSPWIQGSRIGTEQSKIYRPDFQH